MVVDAYVTRGEPALDKFVASLDALLSEYKKQGGGHFDYHIIDTKDEDAKRRAKEAGLVEQFFGATTGADGGLEKGFMGLAFRYGAESDAIKFLAPEGVGLEFWIDNKIRDIRAKADAHTYKIGLLTGHGELSIAEPNLVPAASGSPNLKTIIQQNFPYYVFQDVDLKGGAGAIDPSFEGLVVTQPSSDLSDAELARIDEFILHGKAAVFFVGAANVARGDTTMHATLSTHGLERLLAGYGIELGRDLVVDLDPKGAFSSLGVSTTGVANRQVPFVPLVTAEDHRLDASFPAFFRLDAVAFPLASSISVHPEKQPQAKLRELARSSPRAVRVTGPDVDMHPFKPWSPAGAAGATVLAASIEGTLHGAFDPSRASTGPARVFVVASSQFLANPIARASSSANGMVPAPEEWTQAATPYAQQELTSTILVFKNSLDWLTFEDDLAACGLLGDAGR